MVNQVITSMIEEMCKTTVELREKELAHIVKENDFLVGSPLLKAQLERDFPNIRITYSPYVEDDLIIMLKKATLNFEDLVSDLQKNKS